MSAVARAAELLAEVLGHVPGVTVHKDPSAAVTATPAVIVGPPRLFWEAYTHEPSRAEFPVYLIESMNELTMTRLWNLLPAVTEAIDQHTNATVLSAVPTPWASAENPSLPSYNITVEVSL